MRFARTSRAPAAVATVAALAATPASAVLAPPDAPGPPTGHRRGPARRVRPDRAGRPGGPLPPGVRGRGKDDITIRNLLTHTSGLPADPEPSLCAYPTDEQRWAAVYRIRPVNPPDTATPRLHWRIAAEEYQPGRGLVRGSVHDENAWCLGGVAGARRRLRHRRDLATLAQALLNGGRYGRARILAGAADNRTATLTIPARGGTRSTFDIWYDTAETDGGALEASTDGGRTWRLVPVDLRAPGLRWRTDGTYTGFQGRQWLTARAALPSGTTHLRWRMTTAAAPHGRGAHVDAVRVAGRSGLVFDDRRPRDAARFRADGWARARD
ncbi:serine hydrolase [Asanoa sp. NPDC050611]|uniref:serine hydrolase n=1 Tax=Asanoa sp. NPDC050611 TaxID=3157098 RepID=UPI0033C46817